MSPTRATAVRAAPGAIVFTDIAGFTEFTAARGDEAALALLALQERLGRGGVNEAGRRRKDVGGGGAAAVGAHGRPLRAAGPPRRRPGGPRRERRLPDRGAGRAGRGARLGGGRQADRGRAARRRLRGRRGRGGG